ncbi:MAG: IS256 family transposase [Candidatus Promineifilaceae bacterium]
MATTTRRRGVVKQDEGEAVQVVEDQIEALARQGARTMLMSALNEEVDAYLGRGAYERSGEYRGYRNGSSPRRLTLGSGTVELAMPRVRDVPEGQAPFESQIVRRYQRRSQAIDRTFLKLFIEGLATRDFEPALRLLVGQAAPLSPSTISRLLQQFRSEYEAFDRKDLSGSKFVYVWADGIYLKAGLGTEKACLMVLIGADTAGCKHLIALREGYRESAESWGSLIADCRKRGLNEPALWIADGALGLWSAVNEHSRRSAQQRCTNHKTMNVIDKLPKAERPEYVTRLRAIWQAEDGTKARKLAKKVIADLRTADYERAAACLEDDLDRCLTFYDFPEAHWSHLRTSNVIESPFASVRLRTNAAKRFKKTKSGVCLVHQVMLRLAQKWRHLKSAHLCSKVPIPKPKKKSGKAA